MKEGGFAARGTARHSRNGMDSMMRSLLADDPIGIVRGFLEGAMGLRKWVVTRARRLLPIRAGAPHTLPGQLVVSLTSHPPRYPILDLTLRQLLCQDVKPDVVVLWIAHQDRGALPESVTRLQGYGLTIRECEDFRSFNKIIPALAAYPDAFIVTNDDDVIYPRDWLRRLVEAYRHPREILCQFALRMPRNGAGYAPYGQWQRVDRDNMSGPDVFFLGRDGVLYPPRSLAPETTDSEQFMRLCPSADDVWLNWMAARAGSTARFVRRPGARLGGAKLREWWGSQEVALWKKNKTLHGEQVAATVYDKQIAAMVETYGLLSDVAPAPAVERQSSAPG